MAQCQLVALKSFVSNGKSISIYNCPQYVYLNLLAGLGRSYGLCNLQATHLRGSDRVLPLRFLFRFAKLLELFSMLRSIQKPTCRSDLDRFEILPSVFVPGSQVKAPWCMETETGEEQRNRTNEHGRCELKLVLNLTLNLYPLSLIHDFQISFRRSGVLIWDAFFTDSRYEVVIVEWKVM